MSKTRTYKTMLRNGYRAAQAWRTACIIEKWEPLADLGLVRLTCEYEVGYIDVYGEPEAYTDGYGRRYTAGQALEQLYAMLEHDGCWYVAAQYIDTDGSWVTADGIGMLTGYRDVMDATENDYLADLMESTMAQLEASRAVVHHC